MENKIYCQSCGADITNLGGLIAGGEIYCTRKCLKPFINKYSQNYGISESIDYHKTAKDLSLEILKGNLIHYGKLEKSVSK